MRIRFLPVLAMAFVLSGATAIAARPARADAPLEGNWKLVVLAFGDDEFAIVKLNEKDGKTTATIADGQKMFGFNDVKGAELKDGVLKVTITGSTGETTFEGKRDPDGPEAGPFLGRVSFRGSPFPARLEATKESKVAPLSQSPLRAKFLEIMKTKDPKAKTKMLEEAIDGNHKSPTSALFYTELLSSAEAAGLEADKVADLVKKWAAEAKPYGTEWANEVRLKALKAVASTKSLAKVTLELAKEADRIASDADREAKANLAGLIARAAKDTGMEELAKESEARHAKLNQELDDEYHKKVPPFKPAVYAGRQNKKADQVVLMELFTGAQCPPCVAADVAFDALMTTYKPTEVIGLQYHLHIPGPDPLTNRDSLARQEYYGSEVQSTPSTLFNGHSQAGGGGGMANSNEKYTEYREIIDKSLEKAKGATIDVSAVRAGDQIKVVGTAKAAESGGEKPKGENDKPKRVLRLALTEESVHYVGGNKLRFHHHVVRALPGGADGIELKGGAATIDVAINLADVKRNIEAYVSDFARTRKFPNTLPEIKLENLAVVAFVQDDADKSILHAVSVPVENARP
jgi:hypothetical protein